MVILRSQIVTNLPAALSDRYPLSGAKEPATTVAASTDTHHTIRGGLFGIGSANQAALVHVIRPNLMERGFDA